MVLSPFPPGHNVDKGAGGNVLLESESMFADI